MQKVPIGIPVNKYDKNKISKTNLFKKGRYTARLFLFLFSDIGDAVKTVRFNTKPGFLLN